MPPEHPEYPTPVRPGAGVTMDSLPLAEVRAGLRAGTYVVDEGVADAIADLHRRIDEDGPDAVPKAELRDVLGSDRAKEFRNSVASLVIEDAWPGYSEAVAGRNPGVYGIAVAEDGRTSVSPVDMTSMTAPQVASAIAASNQHTLSHFICEQFADGRVPPLSGNREADEAYHRALTAQTDLLAHVDSEFRTLPRSVGNSSVFVASGALVLRTQVFSVPNVMDQLAARDGFYLTNSQHRHGFDNTLRRGIMPYYLPITHVSVGINRQLVDMKTLEPRAEAWVHNGDPDDFWVYPDPKIVSSVNQAVQARRQGGEKMAGTTGCPAFHSRVEFTPDIATVVPLPRSLPEMGLGQLDRWYYPVRASA